MNKVFIGTSGYSYDHWEGVVYPPEIDESEWFEHYCTLFDTVEINSTYYHMPYDNLMKSWFNRSPDHFRFVLKAPQKIIWAHEPSIEVIEYFARKIDILEHKMRGILWQFSRKREFTPDFEKFLNRANLIETNHFFEFRHTSFQNTELYKMLSVRNMCLVDPDAPPKEELPEFHTRTSGMYYYRMHGNRIMCGSSYKDSELNDLAFHIKNKIELGDMYVYFNNDGNGYAVKNALKLKSLVGA